MLQHDFRRKWLGLSDFIFICQVAAGIKIRDAPITHWPIIGRPIIGAKQSADYRPITD